MTNPDGAQPLIRVVRGTPTAEELAALVGVLTARARVPIEPASVVRSLWRDRAALVRAPPRPGPGAWRASGLPR